MGDVQAEMGRILSYPSAQLFKVVMVENAVSGLYSKGIEELINIGVKIYNTDQLIDEMESVRSRK